MLQCLTQATTPTADERLHTCTYMYIHVQVANDAVTHAVDSMTSFAESAFLWLTLVTDDRRYTSAWQLDLWHLAKTCSIT